MEKTDFKLLFLVDDDVNKQNKKFMGYNLFSNLAIEKNNNIDAVIITSCVYEKEIRNKLRKTKYPNEKIISFFDMG